MGPKNSEMSRLAAETANRLRLMQIDLADETDSLRQERLLRELKGALSSVAPSERESFLRLLEERFPTWDRQVDVTAERNAAQAQSAVDHAELKDCSFLASRLIEEWSNLTDKERNALRDRLAAGGVVQSASSEIWRDDAEKNLRRIFGLKENAPLDARRALLLVDLIADCVNDLNDLSHETWRELSPGERHGDPKALRQTLRRFVTGDQDVSRNEIERDLRRLRVLIASVIHGVRNAPARWAYEHWRRFSVDAIEQIVQKKPWQSLDVACWKQYCKQAADLNDERIAREILTTVTEIARQIRDRHAT